MKPKPTQEVTEQRGAFPLQKQTAWEDQEIVVADWQDLSNLPRRNNPKAGADVQG